MVGNTNTAVAKEGIRDIWIRALATARPVLTKLDDSVSEIFRVFGIPCYGNHGQIRLIELDQTANPGDHLEFDFVGRIANIGLIIEVTGQVGNQRREIQKFVRHCRFFVESPRPRSEKIRLLRGIPRNARHDFERITDWKYVYIGTSQEIIAEGLDRSISPESPLIVFNQEHYDYLKFLTKRIGKFASYEFFSALGISPQVIGEDENDFSVDTIVLGNRKISERMGFVDLYVFTAPVLSLLKTARVIRYGSLDSWIPEVGENYQRLLSEEKLKKMQLFLRKEKDHSSFPNAVTVVLSQDVTPLRRRNGPLKLRIPLNYGSITVIDGQHRLFAYAKSGLSEAELQAARLVVVGINFGETGDKQYQQWSARTFVEINREQTKVPTELIDLISYSAMGDLSPKSLAARVLVELNISRHRPLTDVFRTRPFQRRNRVGGRPVRIVSVTNELKRLFEPDNARNHATLGIHQSFSQVAWGRLGRKRADTIVSEGKRLVNAYFEVVSDVFDNDWASKNSLMFTSNYLGAFCRLLVEFKRSRSEDQAVRQGIDRIKSSLLNQGANLGPGSEIFWRGSRIAPQVGGRNKVELPAIYDFLRQKVWP